MTIRIGFEWSRGFAYKCLPPRGKKLSDWRPATKRSPRVIRAFESPDIPQFADPGAEKWRICQNGRGQTTTRPLEIHNTLYTDFANLDGSPESCVVFANAWGLLTTPARAGAEEGLNVWQDKIRRMKMWIDMGARYGTARMAYLEVALQPPGPNGKPTLLLNPRTLFDAMLVQFAQSAATGNSVRTCAQCGRWFEVGGKTKRSISKFCTDACRNRYHYEQWART